MASLKQLIVDDEIIVMPKREISIKREETIKLETKKEPVVKEIIQEDIEVIEVVETIDYEDYEAMSSEEQSSFFDSFEDSDAFFNWYNKAKNNYLESISDKQIVIDQNSEIQLEE